MSRARDPAKRETILREAKRIFARDGYDAASMGNLARSACLPVGSLYTYFSGKEAIIEAIVEEGWGEFVSDLETGLAAAADPAARLEYLVHDALPKLFVDVDFITILLSEAGRTARLGEKLDRLASLVVGIFTDGEGVALPGLTPGEPHSDGPQPGGGARPDPLDVRMGLAVFLLGTLETVRLSSRTAINISPDDLVDFVERIAFSATGLQPHSRRTDSPLSASS